MNKARGVPRLQLEGSPTQGGATDPASIIAPVYNADELLKCLDI